MTRPAPLVLAGVVLIAITGLIHLVEAPEYLEEQTYIGVLFILNALGAALSAFWLLRGRPADGWRLGILVAAGAFVGFILSRTTGLPSFKETEWDIPGVVGLFVEAGFVAAAVAALRPRAGARPRADAGPAAVS